MSVMASRKRWFTARRCLRLADPLRFSCHMATHNVSQSVRPCPLALLVRNPLLKGPHDLLSLIAHSAGMLLCGYCQLISMQYCEPQFVL